MSLLLYSQLFGWVQHHQSGLRCVKLSTYFISRQQWQKIVWCVHWNWRVYTFISNCYVMFSIWECCQQSSLRSKNQIYCCVLFTDILWCVIWWCPAINKQQIDNGVSHWDTGLDVWTLNGNILNSDSCWHQILLHPPSIHCLPVKDTF